MQKNKRRRNSRIQSAEEKFQHNFNTISTAKLLKRGVFQQAFGGQTHCLSLPMTSYDSLVVHVLQHEVNHAANWNTTTQNNFGKHTKVNFEPEKGAPRGPVLCLKFSGTPFVIPFGKLHLSGILKPGPKLLGSSCGLRSIHNVA